MLGVRDRMLIAASQLLTAFPALLNDIPGLHINNRFVKAVCYNPFVRITEGTGGTGFSHVVAYLANIERILQNIYDTFLVKLLPGLGLITVIIQPSGDIVDVRS